MVCQGPGRFLKGFKFCFIHFEWHLNGITKDFIMILRAIIKLQKDVISLNKCKHCIALYSAFQCTLQSVNTVNLCQMDSCLSIVDEFRQCLLCGVYIVVWSRWL